MLFLLACRARCGCRGFGQLVTEFGAHGVGEFFQACDDLRVRGGHVVVLAGIGLQVKERLLDASDAVTMAAGDAFDA